MQQSLFDQSNLLRIEFQKKLSQFDFPAAIAIFKQLGNSFDPPKNHQEILSALEVLTLNISAVKNDDAKELAEYSYMNLGNSDFLKPLLSEWPAYHSDFAREIARRLHPDFSGYLLPGVHVSEIRLEAGEYRQAVDTAFRHIEKQGEDALLRQIQSYAMMKLGDSRASRRYLSMALFHDPGSCRERFLLDGEIKEEWKRLRDRCSPEKAWIELPVLLWKKELIQIQGRMDEFERFIRGKIEETEGDKQTAVSLDLRFLRLFYLAEAARCRNDRDGCMADYRRMMSAIDPEKYREYIAVISLRERD